MVNAWAFVVNPEVQERIAGAPTARAAAEIGRTVPAEPGWDGRRVDAMRWVLRMKREANPEWIDAALARSRDRPIVEISTRDPYWGAKPVADRLEGGNVLGRLWMELRQQVRDRDPLARSEA